MSLLLCLSSIRIKETNTKLHIEILLFIEKKCAIVKKIMAQYVIHILELRKQHFLVHIHNYKLLRNKKQNQKPKP